MGLDMYLHRVKRYKKATIKDIDTIEAYLKWKKDYFGAKKYTLKEWCGVDEKDINKEYVDFYEQFFHATYSDYDVKKEHPYWELMDEVGYWRKANAIHKWFVKRVQDGIDDCEYHNEVKKEDLEELQNICYKILQKSIIGPAAVINGYTNDKEGNTVPILEPGTKITNPEVAEKLLPSEAGFFFGGTEYDEYYIENIKDTVSIIDKILKTTDFEKEAIYYISSW